MNEYSGNNQGRRPDENRGGKLKSGARDAIKNHRLHDDTPVGGQGRNPGNRHEDSQGGYGNRGRDGAEE